MISVKADAPDATIPLSRLSVDLEKDVWQAILLVPEQMKGQLLVEFLHEFQSDQLTFAEKTLGKPRYVWVLWINSTLSECYENPFGGLGGGARKGFLNDELSSQEDLFKNHFFLSLSSAQVSKQKALPYLFSFLSQWKNADLQTKVRLWSLTDLEVDPAIQTECLKNYQSRLRKARDQVQVKLASPLSVRVDLIENIYPKTSRIFEPREKLHRPVIKSASHWQQWKDKTGHTVSDYLQKALRHLDVLGETLRQAKGCSENRTLENVEDEIFAAEKIREELWTEFRAIGHAELEKDWEGRIKTVEFQVRELFICQPNQLQRWGSVLGGLLFFTFPLFFLIAANQWNFDLIKRVDVVFFLTYAVLSCLVVSLGLYIKNLLTLNQLCRKALDMTNKFLDQIHQDTESNVSYLMTLFRFSAAEQNLGTLRKIHEQLTQKQARWLWLESEINKHLSCTKKYITTDLQTTRTDSVLAVDLGQADSLPCSRNPLFFLPETGSTEVKIHMGTATDRINSALLPGVKSLKLTNDPY